MKRFEMRPADRWIRRPHATAILAAGPLMREEGDK